MSDFIENIDVQSTLQSDGAPEVYLHIGLPKTATTSLQDGVFNQLGLFVDYVGVLQPRTTKQSGLFNEISTVLNSTERDFDLHCSGLAKKIRNRLIIQRKPILISEEMFTVDHNGLSWQQKLGRLGKIFEHFKLKILVTVREPVQATYSLYVELYPQIFKEYPTFSSFFWHSNQADIYRFEKLNLVLANSLPNGSVKYFAFENLIKQVNAAEIFEETIADNGQTIFQLPFINTKNKSALGTFSKQLTINDWLASSAKPISNPMLAYLLRPLLKLQIPSTAVCIPFYSEYDEKIMKKEIAKSCVFLEKISGINYS